MLPIRIQHFSDILCVWAYVSQARLTELEQTFGTEIAIDHHWFHVFGDAHGKLEASWRDKGGRAGYGAHVREIVERFGHVPVHPDIWQRATPTSSLPAHLLLCAARLRDAARAETRGPALAAAIRTAFFRDLVDVSQWSALCEIAAAQGLPQHELAPFLQNGTAAAALARDLDLARDLHVRASPTLNFNDGRQRLTGNVGYRVLVANVRELLQAPAGGQSWC